MQQPRQRHLLLVPARERPDRLRRARRLDPEPLHPAATSALRRLKFSQPQRE